MTCAPPPWVERHDMHILVKVMCIYIYIVLYTNSNTYIYIYVYINYYIIEVTHICIYKLLYNKQVIYIYIYKVQPGFHLWGSFAEYVALPRADENLMPLPSGH